MKGNWVVGMFSGLLSGVLVAVISVFTISASIDTNDIVLPDLRNAEHVFEAPFSGEAILFGEPRSTGARLWGSILIVREEHRERYALNFEANGAESAELLRDGSPMTNSDIDEDENIVCYVTDVGQRSNDGVRPARISLYCPLMRLRRGERYLISSYMDDSVGTVDRFDAAIRYIYRRPRFW